MEITGKLQSRLEKETGVSKAGKEWQKQSIVINTGSQYNPEVCISFFGDKVDLLKGLNKDEEITVLVNVSSREHNGKWFNSIDGYGIKGKGQEPVKEEKNTPSIAENDLPF